jgi:uncharacterized protein YggT (Ycf19 family)
MGYTINLLIGDYMSPEQLKMEVKIPGYLRLSKIIGYVLYTWVLIGVISLGLRVFLLLFSANPNTPFVEFIYNLSSDYLDPFRGIFPSKAVSETSYLDVAALFAIIIYLLIMWGFTALIHYTQFKIDKSVHEQEKEIAQLEAEKRRAQAIRVKTAQKVGGKPYVR